MSAGSKLFIKFDPSHQQLRWSLDLWMDIPTPWTLGLPPQASHNLSPPSGATMVSGVE